MLKGYVEHAVEYLQVASAGIVPDLFALSVQIRHFRVVTPKRRRGARGARPSFKDAVARLADAMAATVKAQGKLAQARNRLEAAARRTDTRGWVVARSERTRKLIELGGLVQKRSEEKTSELPVTHEKLV